MNPPESRKAHAGHCRDRRNIPTGKSLCLLTRKAVYSKINNVAYEHGPIVQLVRTLACHARGQGSDPPSGRQFASVAQSVEQGTENPRVGGSIPPGGTKICGCSSSGRAPPCQGGGSGFEPRHPLQRQPPHKWRHSQAVRQRSAKPLFPGPIPGGASIKKHPDFFRVLFSSR